MLHATLWLVHDSERLFRIETFFEHDRAGVFCLTRDGANISAARRDEAARIDCPPEARAVALLHGQQVLPEQGRATTPPGQRNHPVATGPAAGIPSVPRLFLSPAP